MKKTQRGFYIVGLIIVAGIIGVLTSIGNPLYNDYMTRAKVAEALTLLGVLKNPMVEYYNKRNEWPPIAKVDGKTTGRYTSTIVQGGPETWPNNGSQYFYVEATMKGPGELDNKKLRMTYTPSTKDWDCTVEALEDAAIPNKFLPSYCRSN